MELYIKSIEDPNFDSNQLQVDEDIQLLLLQIETLLFTSPGDVLGKDTFGLSLEDLIYTFQYNDDMLKGVIDTAIARYIPLSSKFPVSVVVEFMEQADRNIVYVDISIDNKYGIGLYI